MTLSPSSTGPLRNRNSVAQFISALSTPFRPATMPPRDARKAELHAFFDRMASERSHWIARNRFFYDSDKAYIRFLVPEGLSILEIGCGSSDILAALRPRRGVGVDLSA